MLIPIDGIGSAKDGVSASKEGGEKDSVGKYDSVGGNDSVSGMKDVIDAKYGVSKKDGDGGCVRGVTKDGARNRELHG